MYQALFPAKNATSPATLRNRGDASEPSHTPPPPAPGAHNKSPEGHQGESKSSPERAQRAVPEAAQTKEGVAPDQNSRPHPGQEPTPQRTDNGRVYTRYWTNQTPRNKFLIASAATIAVSAGVYYWVYGDVDRRHNQTQANNKRR
ncbi:hypothetical protein EV401DRAFT_2194276 [Pisolithus croceorrhizus]|nr:hypothetical protein EV401DRAFT_2194276 [Pisolithus croceorrhizus]